MKSDADPFTYYWSSREEKTCRKFAKRVVDMYSDCGQTDRKNKEHQKFYSKLFEIAVEEFLSSFAKIISPVDFTILDTENKSFHPDITVEIFPGRKQSIHCKSQDLSMSRRIKGISWLVQKNSKKGRKDNRFYNPKKGDLIAVGIVDMKHKCAMVFGICRVQKIKRYLRKPVFKKFWKTKDALYYVDLVREELLPRYEDYLQISRS